MARKLRGKNSINIGVSWGANAPPIFFYLTIVFLVASCRATNKKNELFPKPLFGLCGDRIQDTYLPPLSSLLSKLRFTLPVVDIPPTPTHQWLLADEHENARIFMLCLRFLKCSFNTHNAGCQPNSQHGLYTYQHQRRQKRKLAPQLLA